MKPNLAYQGHSLFFGRGERAKSLQEIADESKGHPTYVYDLDDIELRYRTLKESVFDKDRTQIHYAVKANGHPEILQKLLQLGSGVDIVSGGELKRVIRCGFSGDDIIFSGVAKSVGEIRLALESQIKQLNVESPQELLRIAEIAKQMKLRAPVALRINPDVSPETHPYITTGLSENKFGLGVEFMPELIQILQSHKESLNLLGLTMHIGSQILDLSVFRQALQRIFGVYGEIKRAGFEPQSIDIGGGVGIDYQEESVLSDFSSIREYGEIVKEGLKDFQGSLLIEPGRILVARSGVLLTRVEYIKNTSHKRFAIVNSGMHHLLRPALYQASHRIQPLAAREAPLSLYDIVGPICESSDFLGKDRLMPQLKQGDDLAVCDAGAYGASMVSDYNDHERPLEVIL